MSSELYNATQLMVSSNRGAMRWPGSLRRLVQESVLVQEVRLAERAYSDAIHDIAASLVSGRGA